MLELLNQLDGFDSRGDVKVIMATNRIETLDPALIRPGDVCFYFVLGGKGGLKETCIRQILQFTKNRSLGALYSATLPSEFVSNLGLS